MKRVWMTTAQREDTLLRLLQAREDTMRLREHASAARLYCPHVLLASKKWSILAEEMTREISNIIAQVRAIPVVDMPPPALQSSDEIEA